MNVHQVAFIICADNMQYYHECVRYINELIVPEKFSIDIICIQEADSMARGYQAGMQASDAKYKVYLRQNVFILNRNFIHDILNIFQKDEKIGLIGMVGCSRLPENADYFNCWDIGCMEVFDGRALVDEFRLRQPQEEYEAVQAVQGTVMVTQYDIGWRKRLLELFDGWDFYDVALSLEILKNGWQVVVPLQKTPWCYHIRESKDLKKYEKLRLKMIQEYPEIFEYKENSEQVLQTMKQAEQICTVRNQMIQLMEAGLYQVMEEFVEEIRLSWPEDMQLREIVNMIEIYILEENSSICINHSECFGLHNWMQIYDCYQWIRLVLIRIAYQREDDRIEELKMKILSGKISKDAVYKTASTSLRDLSLLSRYLPECKMQEPMVSVIITVFNGENTVGKTIETVLGQTYSNLEIIIVDDGSTDQSREIISEYKDERIKTFFLNKNNNVCYAGNVGFSHAKGRYIALIGHDDLWEKDKLYKQVSFLEEHPVYSACFTWIDVIDGSGKKNNQEQWMLYNKLNADNFGQSGWINRMIRDSNFMCAPSVCIRREILEKVGYYRYGLVQMQDFDLWLRLLAEGPVYFLQERLTYYRQFRRSEKGQNLSAVNPGQQNRCAHEERWIQESFLAGMNEEKFIEFFQKSLKNPNARSKKEILCEKAFMLWNLGNCFAVKLFIELLEDEETRKILENNYKFNLNDFYKMNGKSLFIDRGYKDTQ